MMPGAANGTSLEQARSRLIARRLPTFAVGWLGTILAWLVIYGFEAGPRFASIALVAFQGGVLAFAIALCRGNRASSRNPAIAAAACALLGFSTLALCVLLDIDTAVLGFILVTLSAMAALFFNWGWRWELGVLGATLIPWIVVLPTLDVVFSPWKLLPTVASGGVLALAFAEQSARVFALAFRRRQAADNATRALIATVEDYRALAEGTRDLIWSADLAGKFTYVNQEGARMLGATSEELMGRSIRELLTDTPTNVDLPRALARAAAGVRPPQQHLVQCKTTHGMRWHEAVVSLRYGPDGQVAGVQGVNRDVTDRVLAEQQLRASEARYRGLVEHQQDLVVRMTPDGQVTFANEACATKFGVRLEEVSGALLPFVHEDDRAMLLDALRAVHESPHRGHVECREITSEGWRWIEWDAGGILEHGVLSEIQAVGRDVTERRAAEDALRASLEDLNRSEDKLRLLARRQTAIREEERKRLGLDLHDDVCQELTGIGILVESLRHRLAPMADENAREFVRVTGYLGEVTEHLRLLARELRPLQLRDFGLRQSLRSLAAGMALDDRTIAALFPTPVPQLSEEIEVGVYRIAQEALGNAVRHASARSIELQLAVADGQLRLEVSDDGSGFDPRDRADGVGLVSMEERALALGGRLSVWSQPAAGTTIRLECPVASAAPSLASSGSSNRSRGADHRAAAEETAAIDGRREGGSGSTSDSVAASDVPTSCASSGSRGRHSAT